MKFRPAALFCAVALTCAFAPPAHAVSQVSQTTLSSQAKRLISYRHQRHLFVTADGRFHIVANLSGQSGSSAALNLQSSDDGLVWTQQRKLGYTDGNSVSDSALDGNVLTVVYQCNDGLVRLATATYDPASKSWSNFNVEKVPRVASSYNAVNPSFTVDGNGNTWVAYVQEDTTTGNVGIVAYRKSADKGTWASAKQYFGDVNASAPFGYDKRSARLVTLPGGIGMLFSYGPSIYWTERKLKGGADLAWNSPTLMLSGTPDGDPMSSHFSTVVDGVGNVFAAFTDAGNLYVNRRDALTRQWYSTPQTVLSSTKNPTAKPVYAQLAWLGGTQLALATNLASNTGVYLAQTSAGAAFKCAELAKHDSFDATVYDFTEPRIELPAFPTGTVPLLQQFQTLDQSLQYAAGFSFDPASPKGCN